MDFPRCCFVKPAACSFPLCPELPLISLGCVRYRRLLTFQAHLQEMSDAVLWSGLRCLPGTLQGKGRGCCWPLVNLSSIQTGKCSLTLRKCIGLGMGQGEGWICVPLGSEMCVSIWLLLVPTKCSCLALPGVLLCFP